MGKAEALDKRLRMMQACAAPGYPDDHPQSLGMQRKLLCLMQYRTLDGKYCGSEGCRRITINDSIFRKAEPNEETV